MPSRRIGGIITAVAAVGVIAAGAVALRLTADEQPSSPAPVISPSPSPTLPEPAAAVLPGLNGDAPLPTTAGIAAAWNVPSLTRDSGRACWPRRRPAHRHAAVRRAESATAIRLHDEDRDRRCGARRARP